MNSLASEATLREFVRQALEIGKGVIKVLEIGQLGGLHQATMRADDHQLLKGLYVSRWQKVDAAHPRSAEETGYTFAPLQYLDAAQISGPTSCQMQRP